MVSLHESLIEYRNQLKKGIIQNAYRGLMDYFGSLRSYFKTNYPNYVVSGNTYFGYMDMTYFAATPPSLKNLKLKVAIVFLHEEFRFEVWLGGNNKKVQKKYWDLVREKAWDIYTVPKSIKGIDSIVENVLVAKPDFRDLDALTELIEIGTNDFIMNVENFFSHN